MKPLAHILLGATCSLICLFFPDVSSVAVVLFFLASVLIDFDHYVTYVWRAGEVSVLKSLKWYDKLTIQMKKEKKAGIRLPGPFHAFHTVEFHLFTLGLCLLFPILWPVFIGMLFHSLCDVCYMIYSDYLYRREFFFIPWFIKVHFK
jgi:hypothetical protein